MIQVIAALLAGLIGFGIALLVFPPNSHYGKLLTNKINCMEEFYDKLYQKK